MKVLRITGRVALGLLVPALIVVWYQSYASTAHDPFYPQVSMILQRFHALWLFSDFNSDVVPTVRNLLTGYLIACAAGVSLGLLMGRSWFLRELLMPLVTFGRSLPAIMLIPPMVLVLGVGDASKIATIAIGSVFPVVVATIDGMRQTEPVIIDVARSMCLSEVRTFRTVWAPSASPAIFGGLQTALQLAIVITVASEMVAAYRGIGYVTMQAQLTFNAPTVWAGIVLLAIIGFLLNFVFVRIRNRVLAWHIGMRVQQNVR